MNNEPLLDSMMHFVPTVRHAWGPEEQEFYTKKPKHVSKNPNISFVSFADKPLHCSSKSPSPIRSHGESIRVKMSACVYRREQSFNYEELPNLIGVKGPERAQSEKKEK